MPTKNFTATINPISDKNPGAHISVLGTVAAQTAADAGTYHVVGVIRGPTGFTPKDSNILYNRVLDTTPINVGVGFDLPANAPAGSYSISLTVRDPATGAFQTVSQTLATFNSPIVVAPVVLVVASLAKISGDDQGGTISTTQAAPMVVRALDASGNPGAGVTVNFATTAGTLSAATATTDGSGNASVTLTYPIDPQTATVTASVGSISATFTQTSHMVLYGTNSALPTLLRPAGPGDALAGVGFLPDSGDQWVLIESASDEFDGTAIDTTKWRKRLPGGYDHYNDELQRYVDSGITVSNGRCKLTARARPYESQASGSYTFVNNPNPGETIRFNGTVVTFVASGATGNQVNIGATPAETAQNALALMQTTTDTQIIRFVGSVTGNVLSLKSVPDTTGYILTLGDTSNNILTSGATLVGGPGHTASPTGFKYPLFDSGCLSSHTLLRYGYFEARMKFPKGLGVWPAFWLLPNTNYQGEIDIVEFVNNGGTEHQNMIHNNNLSTPAQLYWADARMNTQWGYWSPPPTMSPTYFVDDWHTVSCYWNELDNTTTVYIDGFPVAQRKLSPFGQPSAIIFNMAHGGGWPTTNSNGQAWTQPVSLDDQVFEISHCRTWQKAGKILTSQV